MNSILKKVVVGIIVLGTVSGTLLIGNLYINKKSNVANASTNKSIEFEFSSSALDDEGIRLINKAVFKTEYFKAKSSYYNHELAQLSLAMTMASSSTAEAKENWGINFNGIIDTSSSVDYIDPYTARNAYIVDVYKKLGFYNDVYKKYEVSLNDISDTIAYSIAMKDIKINGKKYKLLICNPRSVAYGSEWASNFMLHNEQGLTGFESAGEEFYKGIASYIKKYKLGKNTKIWIPAYSRGAGAANVASARLNEDIENGKYKFSKDDVYTYLFATPNVTLDENCQNDIYGNIVNILNEADLVTATAPVCWGFNRYGKAFTIPQLYVTDGELDRIEDGKTVKLDKETVELIKNISYDYNKIRYANMFNKDVNVDLDKLYIGFTVNKEFNIAADNLCKVIAKDAEEYGETLQGVTTEILPFLISQSKTYSEEESKWIVYETLAEYLSEKYGAEVFKKASNAGVFSQDEYLEKIDYAHRLYNKKLVDENTLSFLEYIVDTYYGIRIIAYKYGLDTELIQELTGNVMNNIWSLVENFNITDPFRCKYVHYAEFYMAWMNNYNPMLQKSINKEM